MQEHIRRAHPENYISKLPATEESFLLMINTPPQDHGSTDQPSSSSSAAQSLSSPPLPASRGSRENKADLSLVVDRLA